MKKILDEAFERERIKKLKEDMMLLFLNYLIFIK